MIGFYAAVKKIIDLALIEDLGVLGDVTSDSIFTDERVSFAIVSREDFLLSGIKVAKIILDEYKKDVDYKICKDDGDFVYSGENIITGLALAKTIMPLERTLLNFLQHCSGISSFTKKFVDMVRDTKVIIRSTRKTAPGLRVVEKYAVEVGGGQNYRVNLSDAILIKDNHIASCKSVADAISKVRKNIQKYVIDHQDDLSPLDNNFYKIAIECDNLDQVRMASSLDVDLILLDNMSLDALRESVAICKGKVKLEASGRVNLSNVLAVANTGVDYISVGEITHSFPSVDLALDIVEFF